MKRLIAATIATLPLVALTALPKPASAQIVIQFPIFGRTHAVRRPYYQDRHGYYDRYNDQGYRNDRDYRDDRRYRNYRDDRDYRNDRYHQEKRQEWLQERHDRRFK